MPENISLKEIERKAFLTYHEDGLIDIVLGLILIIGVLSSSMKELGVSDGIRIITYVPLMFLCPVLIMICGKKKITIPRLGYVKFNQKRKRNRKKLIAAIVTANLLTGAVLGAIFTNSLSQISSYIGITTAIWMAVLFFFFIFAVFIVFAYLHDNPRLYLTGFFLAITEPIYTCLEIFTTIKLKGIIAYGIPGLLLVTLGLFTFVCFLQKYPTVSEELTNV